MKILSALFREEAQIVGGVLELACCKAAGNELAFPTRERNRILG